MDFLSRLFVVLASCAVVAATVAASAVFRRRNKFLRLTLKIPAEVAQVSQLNSSVYELYCPPGEPSMEVLFFHGFQHGDYKDAHLSTWKCRDGSSIWPQTWLVEKFHDARILSVAYDASVIKSCEGGTIDMHLISENLTSDLLSANIGQESCRPVVLVGHSFGGLVIKQICVYASSPTDRLGRNSEKKFQLTTFLENVWGIFFYSTPHQGVAQHIAEHFVAEGPLLEYVKTLSTPRARVNFDFHNICGQYGQYKTWQIAGLGESLRTKSGSFSDVVVEEASARYGSSFNIVEGADHISVCRPMEKTSRSFSALTNFLEGVAAVSKATVHGLPDYPTGLERRVFEVQQKLPNTPVLGIVGMGGIGKTTIAKEVFNKISGQFEYTCFVDNVKGMTVRELNYWLLNHFLRNGTRVNQNSLQWSDLQTKKFLITMDDVDSESQVRILPRLDEFGSGSRLIFTTRDEGVLNTLPKCGIYDVDFLNPDEAKKLFCQHAFHQEGIPDDLAKMNRHLERNVKKVIEKCAGLPLTLEVMGCYLRHQTNPGVWKETIDKLGKAQSVGLRNDRMWSSLKLSYDALPPEEQGMFLEAGTYFFDEPVDTALAAWSTAFGYSYSRWANLLRTCLVKEVDKTEWVAKWGTEIKYKGVWVHEHLRDLANHLSKGSIISRCVGESYGAVDLLKADAGVFRGIVVVPEASARDGELNVEKADHVSISKPPSRTSRRLNALIRLLHNILNDAQAVSLHPTGYTSFVCSDKERLEEFITEVNTSGESGYFVSKAWLFGLNEHGSEEVMSVLGRNRYLEIYETDTTVFYERMEETVQVLTLCDDPSPRPGQNDYCFMSDTNQEEPLDDSGALGKIEQVEFNTTKRDGKILSQSQLERSVPERGEKPRISYDEMLNSLKKAVKDSSQFNYSVSNKWLSTLNAHQVEGLNSVLSEAGYAYLSKTSTTTHLERIQGYVLTSATTDQRGTTSTSHNGSVLSDGESTSACQGISQGSGDNYFQLQGSKINRKDSSFVTSEVEASLKIDAKCVCPPKALTVSFTSVSPRPSASSLQGGSSRKRSTRHPTGDCFVTVPKKRDGRIISTGVDKDILMRTVQFTETVGYTEDIVGLNVSAETHLSCCLRRDHDDKMVHIDFLEIRGEVKLKESINNRTNALVLRSVRANVDACIKNSEEESDDSEVIRLELKEDNCHAPWRRVLESYQPSADKRQSKTRTEDRPEDLTWLALSGKHPQNSEIMSKTLELQCHVHGRLQDDRNRCTNGAFGLHFVEGPPVTFAGDVYADFEQNSFLELNLRYEVEISYCEPCDPLPPADQPYVKGRRIPKVVDFDCIVELRTNNLKRD